ncbi:MAG TPA: FRG domain-containing protein [Syntrophales bacterium]|nr:FRG domain-containing protein [Syntrophales bacterium]
MQNISSKFREISSENEGGVWCPESLDDLIDELDQLTHIASKDDSLILYRGQTNISWPVDSTFVRNSIKKLFNIKEYTDLPSEIRKSTTFHRAIASLLLMKFDKIVKPSQEVYDTEVSNNIDPYFELLKHSQQYPERYNEVPFIQGTNLIDWTHVYDIALYFSAMSGVGVNKKISSGDGVLYLFNASATGRIRQTIKIQQLFDNMTSYEFLSGDAGLPLMLHPMKQTNQLRAANQKPVYLAQMNFSFSMTEVWKQYEQEMDTKVFIKARIPAKIKKVVESYLNSKGINESHVYPH